MGDTETKTTGSSGVIALFKRNRRCQKINRDFPLFISNGFIKAVELLQGVQPALFLYVVIR